MNFKFLKRILCLVLVFALSMVGFSAGMGVSASQESDIKNEINNLEKESAKLDAEIAQLKKDKAEQD